MISATPSITGTPAVGEELTATPGEWRTEDVSLTYQWLADGNRITGATSPGYVLTAAELGKRIKVRVTGSKTGYSAVTATSAATAAVAKGTLAAGTPSISGTVKVGSTLTAGPGAWSPQPDGFAYQWLRDGSPAAGATGTTYVLQPADLGGTISVVVTGSKTGYEPAVKTSAATAAVAAGSLTTATPTISGTAKVGQTLSAATGTWGPAPVTLAYQWLRAGVAITGATKATYVLQAADVGKAMSVKVTGKKTGYTTVSKTSAVTAKVANGTLTSPTPTIKGTAKVGKTLTVTTGTWGPQPVTLKYQWFRSGTAIAKATSATYKLVSKDKGKVITVKVTGSKSGFTTVTKASAATKKVAK